MECPLSTNQVSLLSCAIIGVVLAWPAGMIVPAAGGLNRFLNVRDVAWCICRLLRAMAGKDTIRGGSKPNAWFDMLVKHALHQASVRSGLDGKEPLAQCLQILLVRDCWPEGRAAVRQSALSQNDSGSGEV